MEERKCCFGYGLWGVGEPCPIGYLDAQDGMPTLPCPVCGANKNPIKTEDFKAPKDKMMRKSKTKKVA